MKRKKKEKDLALILLLTGSIMILTGIVLKESGHKLPAMIALGASLVPTVLGILKIDIS